MTNGKERKKFLHFRQFILVKVREIETEWKMPIVIDIARHVEHKKWKLFRPQTKDLNESIGKDSLCIKERERKRKKNSQ